MAVNRDGLGNARHGGEGDDVVVGVVSAGGEGPGLSRVSAEGHGVLGQDALNDNSIVGGIGRRSDVHPHIMASKLDIPICDARHINGGLDAVSDSGPVQADAEAFARLKILNDVGVVSSRDFRAIYHGHRERKIGGLVGDSYIRPVDAGHLNTIVVVARIGNINGSLDIQMAIGILLDYANAVGSCRKGRPTISSLAILVLLLVFQDEHSTLIKLNATKVDGEHDLVFEGVNSIVSPVGTSSVGDIDHRGDSAVLLVDDVDDIDDAVGIPGVADLQERFVVVTVIAVPELVKALDGVNDQLAGLFTQLNYGSLAADQASGALAHRIEVERAVGRVLVDIDLIIDVVNDRLGLFKVIHVVGHGEVVEAAVVAGIAVNGDPAGNSGAVQVSALEAPGSAGDDNLVGQVGSGDVLRQEQVAAGSSGSLEREDGVGVEGVGARVVAAGDNDVLQVHGLGGEAIGQLLDHVVNAVVRGDGQVGAAVGGNKDLHRVVVVEHLELPSLGVSLRGVEHEGAGGEGGSLRSLESVSGSVDVVALEELIGGGKSGLVVDSRGDVVVAVGVVSRVPLELVSNSVGHRDLDGLAGGDIDELSGVGPVMEPSVVGGGHAAGAGEVADDADSLGVGVDNVAVSVEPEGDDGAALNDVPDAAVSKDGELEDGVVSHGDGAAGLAVVLHSAGGGADRVDMPGLVGLVDRAVGVDVNNGVAVVEILDIVDDIAVSHDVVLAVVVIDNGGLAGLGADAQGAEVVVEAHAGGAEVAVVNEVVLVAIVAVIGADGLVNGGALLELGNGGRGDVVAGQSGDGGLVDDIDGSLARANVPDLGSVVHHVDVSVGSDFDFSAGEVVLVVGGDNSLAVAHALVVNDDAGAAGQLVDVPAEGAFVGRTVSEIAVAEDVVAEGGAVHNNAGLLIGQGVEGVQDSLLALQRGVVSALEVAVEDALVEGVLRGVQAPAVADVLVVRAVADSAQKHLGPLVTGELSLGLEGAVAHAVDDALLNAVSDVAGGPTVGINVGERSSGAAEAVSLRGAQLHVGYDLGSLLTSVIGRGAQGGILVAFDDAQADHDANGFAVSLADFVCILQGVDLVASIGSRGTHDGETQHKRDREQKAQGLLESSHVETPPLNSTSFLRPVYAIADGPGYP